MEEDDRDRRVNLIERQRDPKRERSGLYRADSSEADLRPLQCGSYSGVSRSATTGAYRRWPSDGMRGIGELHVSGVMC